MIVRHVIQLEHDERYFPKTTWKSFIKWSASIQKDLDHFQEVFGLEEFLFRAIPQLALLHHGDDIPERGGCRPRKPKLLQQLLVHSRMRRWQDQRVTPWDRTIVLCMWPSLSTTWLGTFSRSKTLKFGSWAVAELPHLRMRLERKRDLLQARKTAPTSGHFCSFHRDDSFSTTCGHGKSLRKRTSSERKRFCLTTKNRSNDPILNQGGFGIILIGDITPSVPILFPGRMASVGLPRVPAEPWELPGGAKGGAWWNWLPFS